MRVDVVPLRREHFAAAAALLAARHRRDRAHRPELPAAFEDEAVARQALRSVLTRWTGGGRVALYRNRVVGYLVATLHVTQSSRDDRTHHEARAAYVSIAGHAVDVTIGADLYEPLYAALAPRWLVARCPVHYVDLPATDADAREIWQLLGFAPQTIAAVRHLGPVRGVATSALTLRPAGPADLDDVGHLIEGLYRHHAGPPMFAHYPAGLSEVRQRQEALLAHPRNLVLLGIRGGQVVGMVSLGPESGLEPIATPERSVAIYEAFTTPDARNIAVAGLNHALAWARNQGYQWCITSWLTANFLSARLMRAIGFEPLQIRLGRHVDEERGPAGDG